MPGALTDVPAYLAGLNEAQRDAVLHDGGPLIVLAGPGTGKTRVIAHRVARLVERDGADPDSIVALTFTNKAAEELRDRVREMVGVRAGDAVVAQTLHAYSMSLVRRFGDLLALPPRIEVVDSAEQRRMMRQAVREAGLDGPSKARGWAWAIDRALDAIAQFKQTGTDLPGLRGRIDSMRAQAAAGPDGAGARARIAELEEVARLWERYDAIALERGALTFNDLVPLAARLLGTREQARDIVLAEHRHVLVDEFQDVDPAQVMLLERLCPPERDPPPDLCVVGDDDQAIYAFRGADPRAFLRFRETWPGCTVIALTETYRSDAPILAVANHVMSLAERRFEPDKRIERARGLRPGENVPVGAIEHEGEHGDGEVIAAMIRADLARRADGAWRDFAVIARSGSDVLRIADALELADIPVRRQRLVAPADDPAVQDVFAWMNLLAEPDSEPPLRRLLARPPLDVAAPELSEWIRRWRDRSARSRIDGKPGASLLEFLRAHAADDPRIDRLLRWHDELARLAHTRRADEVVHRIMTLAGPGSTELLDPAGRAARLANLVAVLRFVRARLHLLDEPRDVRALWAYYQDLGDEDRGLAERSEDRLEVAAPPLEEDRDAVAVITAHSAKGLEFDTVLVPRVSPTHGYGKSVRIEPSLAGEREEDPDEERRVFYVACTRARRRLVLLCKEQKARSAATHFVHELTRDSPAQGLVVLRQGADVLRAAAEAGVWSPPIDALDADAAARRDAIDRARRRARARACEALDAADRPGVTEADLEQVARRLRESAAMLAVAAQVGRDGSAPPWSAAEGLDRAAADLASGAGPGVRPALRAPAPPLDLTFSALRDYFACPRCYYLRHVLGLPGPVFPGGEVGSAVHAALERFFRTVRDADAAGLPLLGLDALLDLGRDALRRAGHAILRSPGDDERVLTLLRIAFEHLHQPGDEILEIERLVRFEYVSQGIEHRMTARIDRVDRMVDGGFRLIDYKTGQASPALREPRSDDLQMGIYAMALRRLFDIDDDDELRGVAEYWILTEGRRGSIGLGALRLDRVRGRIDKAVAGILAGDFQPPSNCRGDCAIFPDA